MSDKARHYKPQFIKDCLSAGTGLVTCSGTVVDLVPADTTRPLVFRLDDGTGTIASVLFRPPPETNVKIGDDVVIYGVVQSYRDDLQIKCDKMKLIQDPNHHTLWINQVIYYKTLNK